MIKVLLIYLIILNVLTLLIYGLDRFTFSKTHYKGHQREYSWLVLVLIGGSIGAWMGMKLWPPRNMAKFFKYSVPIIIALQILTFVALRYAM